MMIMYTLTCATCSWVMRCPDAMNQNAWAVEHVKTHRHAVVEVRGSQDDEGKITVESRVVHPVGTDSWDAREWELRGQHTV